MKRRPMWKWYSNYYMKNAQGDWMIGFYGTSGPSWFRYSDLLIVDMAIRYGKKLLDWDIPRRKQRRKVF